MSLESYFQDGNPKQWGLIVNTSTQEGSLTAFSKGGALLENLTWDSSQRHSHVLLKNFLILKKKYKAEHLSHILFFQGPGSFTGLRVGASFIKSLSLSLKGIPITCFSSFLPDAISVIEKHPDLHLETQSFNILIPSIGSKFFFSKFEYQDDLWVEHINLTGATSSNHELSNAFSSSKKICVDHEGVTLVERDHNESYKAVAHSQKIRPYTLKSTHLDLYPLYLRQSEAEEKLKYDKAKL